MLFYCHVSLHALLAWLLCFEHHNICLRTIKMIFTIQEYVVPIKRHMCHHNQYKWAIVRMSFKILWSKNLSLKVNWPILFFGAWKMGFWWNNLDILGLFRSFSSSFLKGPDYIFPSQRKVHSNHRQLRLVKLAVWLLMSTTISRMTYIY